MCVWVLNASGALAWVGDIGGAGYGIDNRMSKKKKENSDNNRKSETTNYILCRKINDICNSSRATLQFKVF